MKKQLLILGFCFLLLTACGATPEEVQNAETLPPVQDLISNRDETTNTDPNTEENLTENDLLNTDENNNSSEDLSTCEEKSNDFAKELEQANAKIKSLETNLAVYRDHKGQSVDNYEPLVVEYLQKIPQQEYAFDSCGAVGKFFNNSWYSGFKNALAEKDVLFSLQSRPLEPSDFFGGCASSAGKMAFFLGAGFQDETEFHMFKYDTENGDLIETIVAGGKCEDCPVQFGKRNGAYIELYGDADTLYRYYFDKNILIKDSDIK